MKSPAEKNEGWSDWKAADLHGRALQPSTFSGAGFRRAMGRLQEEIRARTGLAGLIETREYDLARIQRDWAKLAGPLAAFSFPQRFRGDTTDTLDIVVENAAYSQELSLYSKEILRNLKGLGIAVKQLRSRQGRLPYERMNRSRKDGSASGGRPKPANPGLDGLLAGLKDQS